MDIKHTYPFLVCAYMGINGMLTDECKVILKLLFVEDDWTEQRQHRQMLIPFLFLIKKKWFTQTYPSYMEWRILKIDWGRKHKLLQAHQDVKIQVPSFTKKELSLWKKYVQRYGERHMYHCDKILPTSLRFSQSKNYRLTW